MSSPVNSYSDKGNPPHLELQPTPQDPASVLIDELMLDIFSRLDLSSLGASRQVCRNWNQIAKAERLWRNVIYREIAFSNRDWARCFGPEVVVHEDRGEELASLPWQQFIADNRKFHELFPDKSGKDHLMLVRIPKTLTATRLPDTKDEQGRRIEGELVSGLTLNSLGQLAKQYFPQNGRGYWYIWGPVVSELGDRPIDRSCWVLMTKDVLEGSRKQSYSEQQEMVANLARQSFPGYEVPGTLEAATCILSQYFADSKTRLYSDDPWIFTRCKDSVQDCLQTIVGGFASAGLGVTYSSYDVGGGGIGVAALRKF